MITCSHCGRQNEDRFNFCLSCGADLKSQRVKSASQVACPACGASVPRSHAFCGRCGNNMGRETTQPPVVTDSGNAITAPLGMRDSPGAKLLLINPDGSSGKTVALHEGDNVLGREHGPPEFRDDPYLSPQHACFRLGGNTLEVRDLDSLNGVFYRITDQTEITHSDTFRVGRQLLRFEEIHRLKPVIASDDNGSKVLGGPMGEAWGRLVRVSGPDVSTQAFLLERPEEVMGRERGAIVFRDDGFVSTRHARITYDAGRYFLDDLRSSNGTFLKIRASKTLRDGDLLLMGQQPLRALLGAS